MSLAVKKNLPGAQWCCSCCETGATSRRNYIT